MSFKIPKKNKYFRYLLIIFVVFVLHFTKILYPVEQVLIFVTSPIISSLKVASSGLTNGMNNFLDNDICRQDLDIIKVENSLLLKENAQLKYLKKENDALRRQLSFEDVSKNKLVLSYVLTRSRKDNTITINKGSGDNLSLGMPVVSANGYLIGKIVKLESSIAHVCLIHSKGCEFGTTNLNSLETTGIISGEMGTISRMNFIPHNQHIKLGDVVITSGLEELVPHGLVVGKVIQVNEESNNIWKNAIIEPSVDLNEINIVSVVVSNK